MSETNLPLIVVKTDISELSTPEMISEALGTSYATDPDVTAPPVTQAALHAEAAALQVVHNKRKTNPPTATAEDERVARDTLSLDYQLVAGNVQGVARKVAKAAGDVAAGIIVVQRTGFKLKKAGKLPSRHFEVYDSGPGWIHVRCKAVGKHVAYLWRYGITPERGMPPTTLGHPVVNVEADLLITNLKSGSIYGIQFAAVKPKEKRTHSDGEEPVLYSDFIYIIVM